MIFDEVKKDDDKMGDIYYSDGFSFTSNPSPTGGGFTIFKNDEFYKREIIMKEGLTSNELEFDGILFCCIEAKDNSEIFTDSKNSIAWIRNGKSEVRNDLNWLFQITKNIVNKKNLKIKWIPRKRNIAGIYNEKNKI